MIFDGDCGFCRRWIERWKAATGDRIDYAPSQEVGARFPEIPAEAFSPYPQHIPRCIRIFIHGAAHEMPISAAEAWVKLVSEFVDRGEYFLVNNGDSGGRLA